VKVRVDPERCQGHTLCAMIAPEIFTLDDVDSAPGPMNAHSVLTVNLIDEPGSKTKLAEERVIAFFRERTGAA